MHMFPLKLSFKIVALAPQIYVRDASGNEILYVRQKLLKLKDKIRVFADSSQTNQLYEIDADRIQHTHGMDITIVTTAKNDDQARELLRLFGLPFRQPAKAG